MTDVLPLTAEALTRGEWAARWGGMTLFAYAGDRRLGHRAVNRDGLARQAALPLPDLVHESFGRHLAWATGPGPEKPPDFAADANTAAAWYSLWLAGQARRAALDANWEVMGARLDAAWQEERKVLGQNAWDRLYAELRTAGAWGGRFFAGGVVYLVPEAKRERTYQVLARHRGWEAAG